MSDLYLGFALEIFKNKGVSFLALLGGLIPALFWLWFWLREDKKRPEPKIRIGLTFFLGMLVGLVVIPIQYFIETVFFSAILIVIVAAFAEELFKYLAAYCSALKTTVADEPIDSIIYLITAALGFSAFENFLYLLVPFFESSWLESFTLASFRFVGASLLHIAASGIIGVLLALSFYKPAVFKRAMLALGLILATCLHAIFNLLIMRGEAFAMFLILIIVWTAIVFILLFFEKVKTIRIKK